MLRIRRLHRILLASVLTLAFLAGGIATKTRFVHFGHHEGIFLLRGQGGDWLQLQDDLFLGDGSRLIAGFDIGWLEKWWHEKGHAPQDTYLSYEWDQREGYGYVVSHFPNGQKLLTNFSRYDDSYGLHTHGLFIGGALPQGAREDTPSRQADSGMAWFDGHRWYHLWCNTNEGIASAEITSHRYPPNTWKFQGSRILTDSPQKIVLTSSHLIDFDRTRLDMERYMYFTAGEPYLALGIKLTNVGTVPATYNYLYADEPWVGDYGSSAGDVGWVEGYAIFNETYIDPRRFRVAGIADRGNPLLGERGPYTGIANFINWLGNNLPDKAYFANDYRGPRSQAGELFPLAGDSRSVGAMWEARRILPGESHKIFLRLGVAAIDPASGMPGKPPLNALPNF